MPSQPQHALREIAWSALTALIAFATACIHSRSTAYDPTWSADRRTPIEQIKFFDTQRPTCEFKEIGHVTAERGYFASWAKVVRKARERAYNLGGDALIGVREATRISGVSISKTGAEIGETTSIAGTVIRFTKPNCRE